MAEASRSRRRTAAPTPGQKELKAPARPNAQPYRRGIERINALLDAAEQILATDGYDAATLKAAGERAGIPTASVYHYFSDRHQVDAELMRRHVENLEVLISGVFDGDTPPTTLEGTLDTVVDLMLGYFRTHPSCVELWFARRSDTLEELVRAFDEKMAEQLWTYARDQELLHPDTPLLVARLTFEAANRLFDVAFRVAPATGDDVVLAEQRRFLLSYLRTYAADPSA
ncbi:MULTISPECIES: TetR/AcrR family transcriptional regulator [Streptomyces]|uniref:TetR/AcrR family transcriptional regulator n=1 Tax=Streptomyces TaxID=1883 RepID=UPI0008516DC5|nr:TetR/AcrR family transcriptional regulator [Streptomyces sp. EN23]